MRRTSRLDRESTPDMWISVAPVEFRGLAIAFQLDLKYTKPFQQGTEGTARQDRDASGPGSEPRRRLLSDRIAAGVAGSPCFPDNWKILVRMEGQQSQDWKSARPRSDERITARD